MIHVCFRLFFFMSVLVTVIYSWLIDLPSWNRFQEACKKYGVPEMDVFQTIDLSEKKDIAMVTATIFALGSAVSCRLIQ